PLTSRRTLPQKISLDRNSVLTYMGAVPPTGGRAREACVTWGGKRRLRPRVRDLGLGRPRPIRSAPGVFGRGPSDPTAPHYDGAALEGAGSGSGEDRTRPTCQRPTSS